MRTIQVRVKPNARASELSEQADGTWIARIKAPPVDGKANAELVDLLAEHFSVSKGAITIKSGAGARLKLVVIGD